MNTNDVKRTSRTTAVATALLLTGAVAGWSAGGTGIGRAADIKSGAPVIERMADGAAGSYAPVVERVVPAVVTVRSERMVRTSGSQLPEGFPFREFFGDSGSNRMPERRQGGLGSGVVVREDGYILTNNHVVAGAEQVSVELTDGRTLKAKVVGTDRASDLAVLKVDAANLHTLTLGDSDRVRVGDVVLAVGNPLGVGQTVTMGIVSGKGRATRTGDGSFEDFIQTDAPINQGNSGGALVSTNGELIGINSQILSPSGGNIGIGFSIPANMARNVMSQLIEHGQVRRGRLGVTVQDVTPELASGLGLDIVSGALVNAVDAASPAASAGVQRGDVITALNGVAVKDGNVLRNEIGELMPGTPVKVTVRRDGKERVLEAKLAELSAARERSDATGPSSAGAGRFGLSVAPLTAEQARELGVQGKTGVVVEGVDPNGIAAEGGLREGDVILEVDRQSVASVDELRSALSKGDRPAVVMVQRGAATLYLTIDRTR